MIVSFPYGQDTVSACLPENRIESVLTSEIERFHPKGSPAALIEQALAHPIGGQKLCELARNKQRVVVIASDHTRPVPSKLLLLPMLREIRAGNPDAEITILIATGCHRASTRAELACKLGEEILCHERVVIHDCDRSPCVCIGKLPSGVDCFVNALVSDADLVVSEGFIEPHFFAGFSGSRKSILPGVANRATVLANHCAQFISSPFARAGVLKGNPIHEDMLWAARAAKLAFILNVVLNTKKDVLYAVAGDCVQAHEAGCRFLASLCQVKAKTADVVIVSNGGYPLDQNIYQAVKGMTAAESVVKPHGIIIMLAASVDGHGGEHFYRQVAGDADLPGMLRRIAQRGREETQPDQWQAQIFLRILQRATVIFVSTADPSLVRAMHMIPAASLQEALCIADSCLQQRDYRITAIPDGVSVIVTPS